MVIQPVIGLIACSVKIPAEEAVVTKLVAEPLTPPSQLAVVPAGPVTLPVNVTLEDEHVIVWFEPALTPVGAVVFCIAAAVV